MDSVLGTSAPCGCSSLWQLGSGRSAPSCRAMQSTGRPRPARDLYSRQRHERHLAALMSTSPTAIASPVESCTVVLDHADRAPSADRLCECTRLCRTVYRTASATWWCCRISCTGATATAASTVAPCASTSTPRRPACAGRKRRMRPGRALPRTLQSSQWPPLPHASSRCAPAPAREGILPRRPDTAARRSARRAACPKSRRMPAPVSMLREVVPTADCKQPTARQPILSNA